MDLSALITSVHTKPEIGHTRQKQYRRLRQRIRTERQSLSVDDTRQSSRQICQSLAQLAQVKRANRIAYFHPNDGEIDLRLLPTVINADYFLPLISDAIRPWEPTRLFFQPETLDLHPNRYGIAEPRFNNRQVINPSLLDVVLFPLVGFDRKGNRLGMGKGYYDRTFSQVRRGWRSPYFIGIAYGFQECEDLVPAQWDIPLQAIVTDKEIINCS